jgi:hypothetical protein
MWRTIMALVGLVTVASSCSEAPTGVTLQTGPPSRSITITPDATLVQLEDLTLNIAGAGFGGTAHNRSQAVWSVKGVNSILATTFINGAQLSAVVPAAFLLEPTSAVVFVQTGDPMGDLPPLTSFGVRFTVLSGQGLSVSPDSVAAGSSDVTVTLLGSGFEGQLHNRSYVFWVAGAKTLLASTFVTSGELKAVIPAALLSSPAVVRIIVLTGDSMGEIPLVESGPVTFTVTQ